MITHARSSTTFVLVAMACTALVLGGCSMTRRNAAPAATPATPMAAAAPGAPAAPVADFSRPRPIVLVLSDGKLAPEEIILEAGKAVRLELRNTSDREKGLKGGAFFSHTTIRTAAAGPTRREAQGNGYKGAEMEALAYHAVNNLIRLTPHEQEVAAATRNPFDDAPTAPTPVDFTALLGNLDNPFGAPAPAAAGAPPAFPNLGAIAATPPPAPTPPPTPTAAPVATTPTATNTPGMAADEELPLLAGWRVGTPLSDVKVGAEQSVFITLLPTEAGTFKVTDGRLFGSSATIKVVPRGELPPLPEETAPAANLGLLDKEATDKTAAPPATTP